MLQKLKNKSEGFTIIEVLIVLAIAGLIILIVFLAVPALQRNARNTQRKNDAAAIASAVANWSNNTSGNLPNQVAGDGTNTNNLVLLSSVSGLTTTKETAKLGYYKAAASATGGASSGKIWINTLTTAPSATTFSVIPTTGTASATAVSKDGVIIVNGATCNTSATNVNATLDARSTAILYVLETASGDGNLQCIS